MACELERIEHCVIHKQINNHNVKQERQFRLTSGTRSNNKLQWYSLGHHMGIESSAGTIAQILSNLIKRLLIRLRK